MGYPDFMAAYILRRSLESNYTKVHIDQRFRNVQRIYKGIHSILYMYFSEINSKKAENKKFE